MNTVFQMRSQWKFFWLLFLLVSCQTPETKILESDSSLETRVFSKLSQYNEIELKRAVIVDVRSRFEFGMSRLPRSFFADYQDWELKGYHGSDLVEKQTSLERLLALNGIDPLSHVVILGKGLQGKGEEFLMAATLTRMGIEKISFMNAEQAKKAIVSKNTPPLQNVPYWHRDLLPLFECSSSTPQADVVIASGTTGALRPNQVFTERLKVIPQAFPKNININVASPKSFWAYGLGLYFKEQGRKPCVL